MQASARKKNLLRTGLLTAAASHSLILVQFCLTNESR